MWKVTFKGLLARKLRLGLTALSIVLGVTFVSGTLVLTDTLNGTIASLYGNVYRNIDFEVEAPGVRNIPESVLDQVRRIPGVAYANGSVSGYAQFLDHSGAAIKTGLEPAMGLSFDPNVKLSAFWLVRGRAPSGPREVVMDQVTAQRYHFSVGERVRILLPGSPETFTISGIAQLIGAAAVPGATFAAFDLPTAQRLFGAVGQLYSIDVLTRPGADKRQVERQIARLLPSGLRVVSGRTLVRQQVASSDRSLAPLSEALLLFGFIALFVGGFTIFNTFSITVGQRTRELALLRVVGAGRGQLFRSVLLEAAMVGLLASLVGLGLGVLAATGLQALLGDLGVPLPSGPLVFQASTVLAGLGIGVGVTLVSAVSPAWRAVRIPPVVALVDTWAQPEGSPRRRLVSGGICAALSVLLLVGGLAGSAVAAVGLGAAGIFISAGMLAPLAARPVASLMGRPLAAALGVPGRLGRENSMRSPRRTAQGATALMVGLALVAAVAVLGASLAQAATSSVDNAVRADLLVTSSDGTLSPDLAGAVGRLAGVASTCTIYGAEFEIDHQLVQVGGACTDHLAANASLRMEAGSAAPALARGQLLVDATTAHSRHLRVGSLVTVAFPQGPTARVRVGGIYQPNALIRSYLVSDAFFRTHLPGQLPGAVLVRARPGAASSVRRQVNRLLAPYPDLTVQTRAQFEAAQTGPINQALGLVYALLSLAVIIAFIGVVNTLLLSIFERTHEIGLLRAVGMKRHQVRAMVRSEALILSLFGAIVGVVLGTLLGAAMTLALKQQESLAGVAVPWVSLVVFLVIAVVLGLVAAIWPARRAARMDVLAAIARE